MGLNAGTYDEFDGLRGSRTHVFACGADMKNRHAFLRDGRLFCSQDYGDLSDARNHAGFLASIRAAHDELAGAPDVVAYDLHPAYFSSQAAKLFASARSVGVQHHHAHVAAILADSRERGPVIGVSFDGTGYGTDGRLWGGEFLIVTPAAFRRYGHLEYMPMPGGEMAVREPWRMGLSLLAARMGEACLTEDFPPARARPEWELKLLLRALGKRINAPLTSSAGRLFDAVSAILGITQVATYEAEAAIELEKRAAEAEDHGRYPFDVRTEDGVRIAEFAALVDGIRSDLKRAVPVEVIARKFHRSLAALVARMASMMRDELGLNKVVLSGGVFQNRLLRSLSERELQAKGFELLTTDRVPVGDLGICVGQTAVAVNASGR